MITVPAGPNTASYPQADNTDSVKAWLLGSAASWALKETQTIYNDWVSTGAFHQWLFNYNNFIGGADESNIPLPPNGVSGQVSDDGVSSVGLVDSGKPSGPIPSYTKRAAANPSAGIKSNVSGGVSLLIGKIGDRVNQIDGTVWQRVS
jgi:hypothetical protein